MRILVPIDGSQLDDIALRHACALAELQSTTVILVTVGEPPETSSHAADERRALERRLDEAERTLDAIPTRKVVRLVGDAARGILEATVDERADLIVMASHDYTGLCLLTHRRVADTVRERAPVHVVICTATDESEEPKGRAASPVQRTARQLATRQRRAVRPRRPSAKERAAAAALDRCGLWATLPTRRRSQGSMAADDEAGVFLHFRGSGLLVALPDEPAAIAEAGGRQREFPILETDALGLGLRPEDLAEGVAICRGGSDNELAGWRCQPVLLVGVDGEGARHPLMKPSSLTGGSASCSSHVGC